MLATLEPNAMGRKEKTRAGSAGKRSTRRKHVTTTQSALLVTARVLNVSTSREAGDVNASRMKEGISKHEMDNLRAIQVNLRGETGLITANGMRKRSRYTIYQRAIQEGRISDMVSG